MLKRPTVSTSEAYPAPPLWVLMKSENFEKSESVVMSDGSLATTGAVLMAMHSSLSPLDDVASMLIDALARLLGRALDNRISTGTLTAPAASGHLTPSYVMEPTPNGRDMVFGLHKSPSKVLLTMDAFTPKLIFPAVTPSLTVPAPVTLVFVPRVNDAGANDVTLPFVDASPQSFQLRLKVPPSTKFSAPAVPKASTAANLFMAATRSYSWQGRVEHKSVVCFFAC